MTRLDFGFAFHWQKNWRESFKPITKRSNRNHVITFDSHLKTALSDENFIKEGVGSLCNGVVKPFFLSSEVLNRTCSLIVNSRSLLLYLYCISDRSACP